MSSRLPYRYSPLPHKDSVRVLELHPGSPEDLISCNLHVLDLTKLRFNYEYEVISYVWGDPANRTTVLCDGLALQVTRNLDDVLRRVRYQGQSRLLWADAICINQLDNEEKAAQVAQMRRVYELGSQVLVWLGQHDEYSTIAIPLFEMMSQKFFENVQSMNAEQAFRKSWNELNLSSTDWKSLGSVLSRPYFSRIWILQEATVNDTTVALCGDSQIKFTAITSVAKCICESLQSDPEISGKCGFGNKGFYHASLMFAKFGDISKDFLGILQLGRECECSDPRDKLFALHHLLIPGQFLSPALNPVSLEPNYTETTEELYLKIATYAIQKTFSLKVLRYVHQTLLGSMEHPSWVPRWDVWHKCPKFGISEWKVSSRPVEPIPEAISQYLTVRGVAFDIVREVHKYHDTSSWTFPPLGIADSWATLFKGGRRYITGEGLASAFALTMAASFFSFGEHKGDAVQNATRHLFAWILHEGIWQPSGDDPVIEEQVDPNGDWNFFERACNAGFLTCPCFVTKKGYLGIGPELVQPGDICCVLFGGEVPFILRESDSHFVLVGESYVHGTMNGEIMDIMEGGKLQDQIFEIH